MKNLRMEKMDQIEKEISVIRTLSKYSIELRTLAGRFWIKFKSDLKIRWITIASISIILLGVIWIKTCSITSAAPLETYTVRRDIFRSTVTETGELEAVNALTISAPIIPWNLGSLKITRLIEDGDEVKKGDLLVEFDKGEVQKSMETAQSELEIAQAELRKAVATQKSQINEMQSDLEKASLQHRIAQLNFELADFKSDIERKKIELQLNDAEIDLDKAGQQIENQKNINQQEINKLKLKVNQAQTQLDEARTTIDKLTVLAPAPGIAIIQRNWYTDNKFQIEDQPWRGQRLIRLPDLAMMQCKVMINEVDISKIDTAQTATISLDAYPDTSFSAHVVSVAALARDKDRDSKVKVFDAILLLDESDQRLIPGMTVSCEILVEEIGDTLFIPLEGVFQDEEGPYVYLKNGKNFQRHHIKTGLENDNFVVIAEGLKENDVIALMDPFTNTSITFEATEESEP